MSSAVRRILPRIEATESPRQPASLPDELLEEILVRIVSPADLARAATACVTFRRLVTDPSFLRRYRSLHPPLVLGFVNAYSFKPTEAPHPDAPAGCALAQAADFSFEDYIPPRRRYWEQWHVLDARDGRVLLQDTRFDAQGYLPDLTVCDPLSRRYLHLPPIPDREAYEEDNKDYAGLLVPSADNDDDDETSFRVIIAIHGQAKSVVLFVFSSGSGSWSACTSAIWDTLSLGYPELEEASSAYGCIYWGAATLNKLVKLDMNRMEFSTIGLPTDHYGRRRIVVEAEDGMLGMLVIYGATSVRYYTHTQNESKRANEWQVKNVIPLPANHCHFYFHCAQQMYIFLIGTPKKKRKGNTAFALDMKTLKIERVCRFTNRTYHCPPYLGFPPSMSPRRI